MNWLRSKIAETTSNLYSTVKNWFYDDQPKEDVQALNDLVSNLAVKIQICEQEREAIHNVARTLQQPIAHKLRAMLSPPAPEMLERRKRMQEKFVERKKIPDNFN
jgi:chaperonin cofactor prefoldin